MPSSSQRRIKLSYSARYSREFFRLPKPIAELVKQKLTIFQENPRHPSLRVKKMRGHQDIWELSVTQEYRITFQWAQSQSGERIAILRHVGTHAILKSP